MLATSDGNVGWRMVDAVDERWLNYRSCHFSQVGALYLRISVLGIGRVVERRLLARPAMMDEPIVQSTGSLVTKDPSSYSSCEIF